MPGIYILVTTGSIGNLTKKTPEDTKTVFKVGSGAIARTEIVNN